MVASIHNHAAPAGTRKISTGTSPGAHAATVVPAPKTRLARRISPLGLKIVTTRGSATAPSTAPTPRAPSRMPYPVASSPSAALATQREQRPDGGAGNDE